mgnify:FL=1
MTLFSKKIALFCIENFYIIYILERKENKDAKKINELPDLYAHGHWNM